MFIYILLCIYNISGRISMLAISAGGLRQQWKQRWAVFESKYVLAVLSEYLQYVQDVVTHFIW